LQTNSIFAFAIALAKQPLLASLEGALSSTCFARKTLALSEQGGPSEATSGVAPQLREQGLQSSLANQRRAGCNNKYKFLDLI